MTSVIFTSCLFNVFIDVSVVNLRQHYVGYHVRGYFIGCLFYADDIIMLYLLQSVAYNAFLTSGITRVDPWISRFIAKSRIVSVLEIRLNVNLVLYATWKELRKLDYTSYSFRNIII